MNRARIARITFLSVGAASHLTQAFAAALTSTNPSLAPIPARVWLDHNELAARSRELLAEIKYPSYPQPGEAPAFEAILPRIHRIHHATRVIFDLHFTSVGDKPEAGGSSAAKGPESHAEVSKALNAFELTPIQRLSVRDYVGEKKAEITEMTVNGKELLILRDPKTHDYVGEVSLSRNTDGSVVVSKLTGATFSTSKSVELPFSEKESEEAAKVLKGSESTKSFNDKKWGISKPDHEAEGKEISIPAVSVEGSAQWGAVSESVAVFNKDGSGYERGMRTNLASGGAGVEVAASGKEKGEGFVGATGGVGAQALKVELFANHFSAPEADEHGEFTRSVLGGSGEAHVTLAELKGQAGCSEEKGCGVGGSFGLFGIGTGVSLNYGAKVKLERESAEGVPAEGMASSPEQVAEADAVPPAPVSPPPPPPDESPAAPDNAPPAPNSAGEPSSAAADADDDSISDAEERDYQSAVKEGSVTALEGFLAKYPDSVYQDEVRERQSDREHPGQTPGDETKIY